MRRTRARVLFSAAGACVLLAVPGCGGGAGGAAKPSPSIAASHTYISHSFGVPLAITVPTSLGSRPVSDTRTLLTWVKSGNKVRFLLPAVVYRPGGSGSPEKPPTTYKGYLAYLHEQAGYHANWRDEKTTTVGGGAATLLTGSTNEPLDGSFGCPTAEADPDKDCFGLQPDNDFRVAVIDVPGGPLVVWTPVDTTQVVDTSPAFRQFEGMLQTLTFR
ncbi:hypothetical protein [Streptomyces sp. NPDC050564]|uniref:hypothetical protein n=1 Tax=Streptomyces sp. NPDC050564 TaxID=3365631 RepID=UPI0037B816F5